jgi:crotonobetainyl-CoA:carnitine CoA-transferase CaiB-like acyl-CoA transferase
LGLCERIVYQYSFAGVVPKPEGNAHPFFSPFGLYEAKDGWVTIACPNDAFWAELARIMGRDDLVEDDRTKLKVSRAKNRTFVNDLVSQWTRARTKRELASLLGGRVPFGPVQTVADIFADPHVEARGMLAEVEHPGSSRPSIVAGTPIRLSATPGGVHHRAPYHGEHTLETLRALGYGDEEIAGMRTRKAILVHEDATQEVQ